MTTSELIDALRKADPDGTTPVCVGNADVYFVQTLPAYYNGRLQQLIHDESKRGNAWSVIGAKIVAQGMKVSLVTLSVRDALMDMPDLPIEGGEAQEIELWRAEARTEWTSPGEGTK